MGAATTAAASATLAAVSATWIAASDVACADIRAGPMKGGIPFHAGIMPMSTDTAGGPPVSTGGRGWTTGSAIRAAGGTRRSP